ncbi:threonine dehydratase, putative [Ichthyophthirius multifiliis]|uniref:Threonine dehydratase n=1 Tax=Ichthyophthirius multifiliis TaxID=5932 RepID=G0QWD4_ICHMU|nr:threonine dehydratase, putative [Ichthyophthirius multifiliis]EGR30481.1 threonine dehydratase, putative [Ichthyophthirius multifiliis]|eukprot:XP_004032068.1 threonine dehydratase, putative [Ichthyophthirius multifiliis]
MTPPKKDKDNINSNLQTPQIIEQIPKSPNLDCDSPLQKFRTHQITTLTKDLKLDNQNLNKYQFIREPCTRKFTPDYSKLVSIDKIYKAYKNIRNTVVRTPLTHSYFLSQKYGANIYLKREDQQVVRSFKLRGAYNKFLQLSKEDKQKGIVCASAGNHAQGVAYCCNKLKVQGIIFMPTNAPSIKLRSVRSFGGDYIKIQQVGENFDECSKAAKEYSNKNNSTFVHAYDDEAIIAGQGTVAVEILEDFKGNIDYVFCCVGGGGLCAGIGSYFKHVSPDTVLVPCEPSGCPSMKLAIETGKPEPLQKVNPFVDGAAVGIPGIRTHEILSNLVDSILLIPEGVVCQSLLELYNMESIVCEPAGALAISGLNYYQDEIKGKNVVCIISGSNNDLSRLTDMKMLSQIEYGILHYMLVDFHQKPGSLREFIMNCMENEDDIVSIEYTKKNNRERGPAVVSIECPSRENFEKIKEKMAKININYKILLPGDQMFNLLL